MAKLLIPELFKKIEDTTNKAAQVSLLRSNSHPALKDILRINFDADVVTLLPKGAPTYEKDDAPAGYSPSSLFKGYRKFKYFFKGPIGNQCKPIRREGIFLSLIESMHPSESEVLIQAKDKSLKIKGLTGALVDEAFPGLVVKAIKKPAPKKATTSKKKKEV
jgi:hypothetical protein